MLTSADIFGFSHTKTSGQASLYLCIFIIVFSEIEILLKTDMEFLKNKMLLWWGFYYGVPDQRLKYGAGTAPAAIPNRAG